MLLPSFLLPLASLVFLSISLSCVYGQNSFFMLVHNPSQRTLHCYSYQLVFLFCQPFQSLAISPPNESLVSDILAEGLISSCKSSCAKSLSFMTLVFGTFEAACFTSAVTLKNSPPGNLQLVTSKQSSNGHKIFSITCLVIV